MERNQTYGLGPENKGYQMLKRKGWNENDGLGKDNQAPTVPFPTHPPELWSLQASSPSPSRSL